MNFEIKRENWREFFESLSNRRFGWKTRIEILQDDMGDQILTKGLPLNGITVGQKCDRMTVELSVGEKTDAHQTHMINDPLRVSYFLAPHKIHGDVIEIEGEGGTKTLISFVEPMGILVGCKEVYMAAAAA